jgi:peptidoglycan/LPS O-acetylase OafA/YrhL
MKPEARLSSLDGLRGVAILLVLGFHYFHATPIYYPFGDALEWIHVFKYGFLGVELFFLISGFVIAMTLEKCSTPLDFVIRRFARIWPALLICSIVTFIVLATSTSHYASDVNTSYVNFLPSLTLTPNIMWSWAFPKIDFIDGPYWSLLVEARFYLIALIVFWTFDRKHFARNLVIFTYLNILLRALLQRLIPGSNQIYSAILVPDFMPWFAAGAVFYDLYLGRIGKKLSILLLASMFFVIARTSTFDAARSPLVISVISFFFFSIFWFVATKPSYVNILQARWLVFIGVCSYSVYLLHNGIGLTVISMLPNNLGSTALEIALVLLVAVAMVAFGYLSFLCVERPFRKIINDLVNNRKTASIPASRFRIDDKRKI